LLNLGIGIGGILGGLFVDVSPIRDLRRDLPHRRGNLPRAAGDLPGTVAARAPAGPADERSGGDAHTPTGDRLPCAAARPVPAARPAAGVRRVVRRLRPAQHRRPAFGREVGGISTQALGLAFAANTAVIVVLQLFVPAAHRGSPPHPVIVVMSAIWGVSFLALGATGLVPGTVVAALLFGFCAAVFGFGETFFQPTLPAMINDLAPTICAAVTTRHEHLVAVASVAGPAVAGVLIGHGWNSSYIAMLVGGLRPRCLAGAGDRERRCHRESTASGRRRVGFRRPVVPGQA
jgi:hypothetical protein